MPISFCPVGGESYALMPGSSCPIHGVPLESIMFQQGTLNILGEQSTLDGVMLARPNFADPFAAATNFVIEAGMAQGDMIEITGSRGTIGGVTVLFIDSARHIENEGHALA
jgi:hypothetical protein